MLKKNLNKVCRVCLGADPCLVSLFIQQTTTANGLSLAQMISQCTNYKVSQEDEFPQLICNQCVKKAHAAYNFKKLYEWSHHTLTELLASVKKSTEQNLKPIGADQECRKTQEFTETQPSEQLVKTEFAETEFFETIEIQNKTEASSTFSETSKETGRYGALHPDYVQEGELIIKDEKQTDDETEESKNGILDTEKSDQLFRDEKIKAEEEERSADTYHQKDNKTVNPNQYQKCDSIFIRDSSIKNHMSSILDREKPYKCEHCEEAFTNAKTLIVHKRLHKRKPRPYQCKDCYKSFRNKRNLNIHRRLHTGEKPYKCEDCDKSFAFTNSLSLHKRLHTHAEPYQCIDCGQPHSCQQSLDNHRRMHAADKRFKCQDCNKFFLNLASLKTHKRLHTGGKPYKCQWCSKSFATSSTLSSHKKIHTGERPYKCKYCDKTFAHVSNLNCHKSLHRMNKETRKLFKSEK